MSFEVSDWSLESDHCALYLSVPVKQARTQRYEKVKRKRLSWERDKTEQVNVAVELVLDDLIELRTVV